MADCLFCNIVNHDIPADIVYEDTDTLAFKDIAPQAPHHILIIPKRHISTINDVTEADESLLGHLVTVAKQLATDLGVEEDGYRLLFNTNPGAGQTVFHIHLHLLAGRRLTWPPG